MEVPMFKCDCCGKDLDKTKWTISQHYQDSSWDGLMEEYETYTVYKVHHLCNDCWEKISSLIIKN